MIIPKIGIGIVTYQREDYFKILRNSLLLDNRHFLVVCNDGLSYNYPIKCDKLIQHTKNTGVGIAKNDCLRYLLNQGCEYIFLIEDDMEITNNDIFDLYIEAYKETKIPHLIYHYGVQEPKDIIKYKNNVKIALYSEATGSFGFFHKSCFDAVGLFDEHYINVIEHADFAYMLARKGLLPPFGWFPDIVGSKNYIQFIDGSNKEEKSSIIKDDKYKERFCDGYNYFIKKYGFPMNRIKTVPLKTVVERLKKINEKI